MTLLVLGINHETAPVSLREKVAFVPEQMEHALNDAMLKVSFEAVVILSTCNRTELIGCVAEQVIEQTQQRAQQWLSDYHQISVSELQGCSYQYYGDGALRHLMSVAAGLDSMVLGEPQIFGQMKSAYSVAQDAKTVSSELNRVFQQTFSVAKQIRTDTAIGENPVSVAFAAVNLARRIFADLKQTRALLIGAGETIELVARHLREQGVNNIVVANRTLQRGLELARNLGDRAEAILLADMPQRLASVDIVISSTASQLPILGKGTVEEVLKGRKHRPILMIDIAVPRDIEPQVGDLSDVYLYAVDDLKDIINENKRLREKEARKADAIIEKSIEQFAQQLRSLDAVSSLRAYRSLAEETRDAELNKAIKQLQSGTRAEEVLASLARSLTNKLIHTPSVQMKKASAEGRSDVIEWSRELLGLYEQKDDARNDSEPKNDDPNADDDS